MPDYNPKATAYWSLMVVLGGAVLLHSGFTVAALEGPAFVQVLACCVIAMLTGMFPVRIPGSSNAFAAGEIFILLLLMMHGAAAASLAAGGEAFVTTLRSSKRWTSRLVSPALSALSMGLVGQALTGLTEGLSVVLHSGEAALMLSAVTLALAHFLTNTILLNIVVQLKRDEPLSLLGCLRDVHWVGMTYAASALVASLLFLAFHQVGAAVLTAAVPMIAMLMSTLHHYGQKREATDATRLARIQAAERESAQAAQHARDLQESERRFHSAFSHAAIGMALVAPNGPILQANEALCRLLGRRSDAMVGRQFTDFTHAEDRPVVLSCLAGDLPFGDDSSAPELRCLHQQGHDVWITLHSAQFSESDSQAPCLILQAQDVTARRAAEAQLQHVAYHDSLTGLANRARFRQCLTQAIARCTYDLDWRFAVMYLDFDRFKLINDTLGHSAGDEFLIQVAKRIQQAVRPTDTVGRLGGDEFAILVDGLDGEAMATGMAEHLQESLRKPYVVGGSEINSSASIGITCSSIGYVTPDEVLRDADIAMYRAKSAGRARSAVFDEALRAELSEQVQLEAELRKAFEHDQLGVAYQPIFDIVSGRVIAFEALARWNHPERGVISPDVFIPIAEESGLIPALTRHMLFSACRQLAVWRRLRADIGVQVNISGAGIYHPALAADVLQALTENGVEPSLLTLEITESTLMTRLEHVIGVMTRLREIGVGLSIDDFGTGYSSLSYLSKLPITELKIDRSFVSRLASSRKDDEIVKTIIALGKALGKAVIAEGIETAEQLARLRSLGCTLGQGYLLGPPEQAQAASALLHDSAAPSDSAALRELERTRKVATASMH